MRAAIRVVVAAAALHLLLLPRAFAGQITQFSMAIADADRIFAKAAAVTISFTPSNAIPTTSGYITLHFPAALFKNAPCYNSCPFTYKSSISSAFLSTYGVSSDSRCNGNNCTQVIANGAQSSSPTGATIPANSLFTITISGLVLGAPVGNIASSVYVSTSSDAVASAAVDSGYIGLGSYVNGSCPYGMTWSTEDQGCTSCSTRFEVRPASSGGGFSAAVTGLICSDFSECLSCTACPNGQSMTSGDNNNPYTVYPPLMMGPPSALIFYACSNSSTRCPAGSGMQFGDNGGCSPCPFDMYNDGSSSSCRYCPSGTYPTYSLMKSSARLHCNGCGSNTVHGSVKTGYTMKKSATSCSPQCPPGTGVLSELQSSDWNGLSRSFNYLLGQVMQSSSAPYVAPSKDKGCFPCSHWTLSKDNACQACNQGANDRASLNVMGDTFIFATRCIPNICPWPYVVPGMEIIYSLFSGYSGSIPAYDASPVLSSAELCRWSVHLGGTVTTIALIAVILLSIYVVCILFAAMGHDEELTDTRRRKLVVGMLLTTVSPAVDFISDLMYIVSTLFYDTSICIVCCCFYLLPMFFFWRMLQRHGVHFGFYILKPPAFAVMEKYDSIPKALLGMIGYIPLYIINLPISLPLFLLGHVLYCCKVFPISRVSNLWLRLYTRSTKHTSSVVIIIPLLQESIFEEMLTESVPQMVIQIVNNTLTNVWSPLSYFSTAMSGAMILNGIWRMVYYRLYLKINIDAIPTDLSEVIFRFKSIEEGESPLGKFAIAKVAPQVELSAIVSSLTESDEFSPLIQRHVSASAAELRAEIQLLKNELIAQNEVLKSEIKSEWKNDVQEINQRSLRIEAQLQELISRTSAS